MTNVAAIMVLASTGTQVFSQKVLDSPETLSARQTVQVEVGYSFRTMP